MMWLFVVASALMIVIRVLANIFSMLLLKAALSTACIPARQVSRLYPPEALHYE